ncbi:MAG TPA: rhomboid family intramembrane serine protease [Candidatus Bathyarchaeia archaeon]|nr:rhomboid family intramembrane serine protease [Candidatus Bathyarchaeia archaeon]
MEPASRSPEPRWVQLLSSPTLIISAILVVVYIIVGIAAGSLLDPIQPVPLVYLLMQCDNPTPIFPWTIITAIFLHANILHIASNLVFLLFFGFVLEEQVSKSQWIMTFFVTGLVGSISFVGYDSAAFVLTGFPNPSPLDCAVGASGAVYGIMGTAVGLKIVILLIFLLGLNIFAGGGTPAHLGGLVAGLVLRNYWSLGDRPFRGI